MADPVETSPTDAAPPPPRVRNGWRLAFIVLLAANLLVVGVLAGTMLRHGGPDGRMMSRDLGFGPFSEALTDADRDALRGAFRERRRGPGSMQAELAADVAPILAIMRSEPLDAAALERALDALESGFNERITLGRALIVERIVAMTPAERAAFVERMERALQRGGVPRGG
jgi:uncharacterized membrane protein